MLISGRKMITIPSQDAAEAQEMAPTCSSTPSLCSTRSCPIAIPIDRLPPPDTATPNRLFFAGRTAPTPARDTQALGRWESTALSGSRAHRVRKLGVTFLCFAWRLSVRPAARICKRRASVPFAPNYARESAPCCPCRLWIDRPACAALRSRFGTNPPRRATRDRRRFYVASI